jgi:hypothetical protein
MAELGILEGASLRMFQEFLPNVTIDGYEFSDNYINNFKNNYSMDRINLYNFNVTDFGSIKEAFRNKKYDLIIEDTTHQFPDQINAIKAVYDNLNPGGVLIIEDIFLKYNEEDYRNELKDLSFQKFFFITMDHERRCSTGWNNDKLLILMKPGENEFKFLDPKKLTIITPCCRPENLIKLKNSINFDFVNSWIIVYDSSKVNTETKQFDDPKIEEYSCQDVNSTAGNVQRNFALDLLKSRITNTNNDGNFIYFLDDDNLIHPELYNLLSFIDYNKFYSFNQDRKHRGEILTGNHFQLACIDTAMVIVDFNLCKDLRWDITKYSADGVYICEIYNNNSKNHIYVNNILSSYNCLNV